MELHALFGVLSLKHGADFLIHRAQDLGQHFHHRHLRADGIEEAGELHADDPAANHHQPLGLLRQGKDFPVGDNRSAKALPKPRNGRDNGLGARANQNLAGLIVLFSGRQLEGIGPLRHNGSGLPDHLHAGIPHLDANAAHKLFHHLVLALENSRNIYGSLRNGNAVFVGMARIIIYFCTVEQRFGRDAALIEAYAAQFVFFKQDYGEPGSASPSCGYITGRAAAQNSKVKSHSYFNLRSVMKPTVLLSSVNSSS